MPGRACGAGCLPARIAALDGAGEPVLGEDVHAALVTAVVFAASGAILAAAERLAPIRAQALLRAGVRDDLVHAALSNAAPAVLVGALSAGIVGLTGPGPLAAAPWPAAWLAVLAVTELTFYAVHRAMHRHAWLWRLHALHHEPAQLDWLAGFRKHVGEALLHGLAALPLLIILGPPPAVLLAHSLLGVVMTGFTHWNVRWRLGWLERLVVTPRLHAWHHAADGERGPAVNLAGKLAVLDALFGTRAAAAGWPTRLGLTTTTPAPRGWWAQQRAALRREEPR